MAKLVAFGPFRGFFSVSLDFDATNGGTAQCLCPSLGAGRNASARGYGWGLIHLPEAVGGA